jgi:hypothetical protein
MSLEETIRDNLKYAESFKYGVISGLPKTGTTLPLTLLDGHPELSVFPEELRFMDSGCHIMKNMNSAEKFLENGNTRMLQIDEREFDDLKTHGGTGYGKRNYSNVDFEVFQRGVAVAFECAGTPLQRYFGIFLSYEIASGGSVDALRSKSVLVSKSPHNELYLFSWERMLKENGLYVWIIRDPVELYFSHMNIAVELGDELPDPAKFSELINGRDRLLAMSKLSPRQLRVQKYEALIANPEEQMKEVADFLSIAYHPDMMRPTKNSVPWSGNSSRGIRQATVYNNPFKARSVIDRHAVLKIETMTAAFMEKYGYDRFTG